LIGTEVYFNSDDRRLQNIFRKSTERQFLLPKVDGSAVSASESRRKGSFCEVCDACSNKKALPLFPLPALLVSRLSSLSCSCLLPLSSPSSLPISSPLLPLCSPSSSSSSSSCSAPPPQVLCQRLLLLTCRRHRGEPPSPPSRTPAGPALTQQPRTCLAAASRSTRRLRSGTPPASPAQSSLPPPAP